MKLPENPAFLLNQLLKAGFDAYVVGGCVRDALLSLEPKDWDICTSARPEEIKQVFSAFKTIDIGMKHGTVAVILEGEPYEITTFRTDGSYHDSRRPDSVQFVRGVKEDLLRRDFTVNAMAYNEKKGLVDVCGGREDLNQRILRTVGEADVRFGEDALRIMRCLRFAATYGFQIEAETAASVFKNKELLRRISVERVNAEFSKLLCGSWTEGILCQYQEVLAVFLPELHKVDEQAYRRAVALAGQAPAVLSARLAAFFSPLSKEELPSILRRMKYSNEIIADTAAYSRFSQPLPKNKIELKLLLSDIGFDSFDKMLALKEALGENVSFARDMAERVRQGGECIAIKDLAVNGEDLSKEGYSGREIGHALAALLEGVIKEEAENSKTALLGYLKQKFHKIP